MKRVIPMFQQSKKGLTMERNIIEDVPFLKTSLFAYYQTHHILKKPLKPSHYGEEPYVFFPLAPWRGIFQIKAHDSY